MFKINIKRDKVEFKLEKNCTTWINTVLENTAKEDVVQLSFFLIALNSHKINRQEAPSEEIMLLHPKIFEDKCLEMEKGYLKYKEIFSLLKDQKLFFEGDKISYKDLQDKIKPNLSIKIEARVRIFKFAYSHNAKFRKNGLLYSEKEGYVVKAVSYEKFGGWKFYAHPRLKYIPYNENNVLSRPQFVEELDKESNKFTDIDVKTLASFVAKRDDVYVKALTKSVPSIEKARLDEKSLVEAYDNYPGILERLIEAGADFKPNSSHV